MHEAKHMVSISCFHPLTFKWHKPWDGTEVSGSFGLILSREPHLQQLLGPLEEMCTVIFHHETTDTQQKILIVGSDFNGLGNPPLIRYNLLRCSPWSKSGGDLGFGFFAFFPFAENTVSER